MNAGVSVLGRLARTGGLLLATFIVAPAVFAADATDDFRILYFEPLAPLPAFVPASSQLKTTDDPLLAGFSFDAYGRRFELNLERNAKLLQDAAVTAIAYRGGVVQQAGSWVRLTRIGDELHGMIWDGAELYVIEPASDALEFMVAPLNPAQQGNVIYRLSDTLIDLGQDFCSATDYAPADPATDGLATFKTLASDLKTHVIAQQAPGASLALRISALGDVSLRQRYATEAEARDAILVRLNNVDGIFSAQLGVEIQASSLNVYTANDPFSSTTDANSLLGELASLRNRTSLKTTGLTHLFTGRDLDGPTVGIAYVNQLCQAQNGVGLTQSRWRDETLESLVAAHEIGHNFGARHDGDPSWDPDITPNAPQSCNDTPANQFIMAAQANQNNDTFSQCSIDTMVRSRDRASCISALPPADVMPMFAAPPAGLTAGQSFAWSVAVANIGTQQATDAGIVLTLPAGIAVDDATVTGGSCSNGAGAVQCVIGPLPGNSSSTVNLQLHGLTSGSFAVTAQVSATNDPNAANNSASATLSIDVAVPASSGNVPVPTAGSGGGGGATEPLVLIALSLLALARCRRVPAT